MARKARTHYAILGLLCWKPMSGYDIKKLIEAGEQRSKTFGAPAVLLAGIVIADHRGGLFQVIPTCPTDDQARVAIAFAVWIANPAFFSYVQFASQSPVVGFLKIG